MSATISIICPLYNAAKYLPSLHQSLTSQKDVNITEIKYILTESSDSTEDILKETHCNYQKIKPEDFSHSLTREKAAMSAKGSILVFITQDVEIKDNLFLKKLTAPIAKGEVAATYARQISKYNNIEKYTRESNYPDKSHIVSQDDINKLGLKTFFFSDAASAIDAKVFKKLGGYDGKDLPISEDMYFAYKLITNGYKIKYCADAVVYHSHNFKLKQLYKRYKLTGQFMKQNSYLDQYGTTESGAKMAKHVFKRLIQEKRFGLLFRYPFDMSARYLGMKAGKR